uniref:Uncharacterized protein n=1 Tax=viral metagenome TaxID=1070528 RepID=A0A6M3LDG4_9ZZZZ
MLKYEYATRLKYYNWLLENEWVFDVWASFYAVWILLKNKLNVEAAKKDAQKKFDQMDADIAKIKKRIKFLQSIKET